MLIFFLILALIASLILILIIIAQNPKGGGLTSTFGGSMTSNIMGVRQTTDFLEKSTWYIAIGIFVLVVLVNFFVPSTTGQKGANQSRLKEEIETIPSPMPQQQMPGNQPQQPRQKNPRNQPLPQQEGAQNQ